MRTLNARNEELGQLAMQFRGTRIQKDRERIVEEYAQVVGDLVRSGGWTEMPSPEDQLPDELMPPVFFEYWLRLEKTN